MLSDDPSSKEEENKDPFIIATEKSCSDDEDDKDDGRPSERTNTKREFVRRRIRGICTVKMLKRRFPFLGWIPGCSVQSVLWDCMAGFTVALTAIPQSIAFAAVAGVPLECGLYAAFAGPVAYSIFGSVKHLILGPTTLTAIMTQEYSQIGGVNYAIMLSFMAGAFEFLAGLLNLGFLMNFISGPVISAFSSAAATTVIVSQFKVILGLTFAGSNFIRVIPGVFTHWRDIHLWNTILGLAFITFLQLLKNLKTLTKCCRCHTVINKILWFVSTCRNALAVVLGILIAYVLELYDYHSFNLTGEIKAGIPSFQLPPFNGFQMTNGNISNQTDESTEGEWISFGAMMSDLGTGVVMIPMMAILETTAVAKAFSGGTKMDSTQEMIALGMGSMFCSFFGSIPLSASFSRSAIVLTSGGRTQLASLFSGLIVLLALAFLMPLLYYIPKSVLSAIIITAIYPAIAFREIMPMWRSRRVELFPLFATYLCCLLLSMEYGILIGAQIHLLLLAFESNRTKPNIRKDVEEDSVLVVVKVDRDLYYPSVERFRNVLTRAPGKDNRSVVIDMSQVTQVDYTLLKMMKSVLSTWDKSDGKVKYSFSNVRRRVGRALQSVLQVDSKIITPLQ